MRSLRITALCALTGLAACTPFTLAPGAVKVKLTKVAADVAGCAPVGNVRVPRNQNQMVDVARAAGQLQNDAIGLGGNVVFVTEGTPNFPEAGVAYKCALPPKPR